MNFIQQHISHIIGEYSTPQPLSEYLKDYFAEHKKLGSRDRKAIRDAIYTYFRWQPHFNFNDNPLTLIKWCVENKKVDQAYLITMMADIPYVELEKKSFLVPQLSKGLDNESYQNSLEKLPSLFIRIPKNKEVDIIRKLKSHTDDVKLMSSHKQNFTILRLPNSLPIQDILHRSEYIVQDYASQLSIIKSVSQIEKKPQVIWDVCAGAGGKTIIAAQILNPNKIISFDIRPQILLNLRQRVDIAKIQNVQTITHDWSKKAFEATTPETTPDLIICDVPCTGSGTWGRTPEQIQMLNEEYLDNMTKLQDNILNNAMSNVKKNMHFLYITCSVFHKENEEQIERIAQKHKIEIIDQQILDGQVHNSDYMFFC